jgi:phosphoserine phosphatase RsbU/P
MRILVAEDTATMRELLKSFLTNWGYEVVLASDGNEAWQVLQSEDAPMIAILDWMMPGMDGLQVCRHVREAFPRKPFYIILLTANEQPENIAEGLQAGADDYLTKPFNSLEMRARLQVGTRMVKLQSDLADQVKQLEKVLAQVRQLHGLLPICSYCKKVRDDQDYWHDVEEYITERSDLLFSHGYCPTCMENIVKPDLEERLRRKREGK